MSRRFSSPQPNVPGQGIIASYTLTFWGLVVAVGLAAGLSGVALMALLHALEHLAWSYDSGTFLAAVKHVAGGDRVLILLLAGILAGIGAVVLRWLPGVGGSEVSEALWIEEGRLAVLPSLGRGVLSIIVVALGASLGREAAPQLAGASIASRLCDRAGIPRWQRRLLVACGAGAGMAAVYNVPLGGALFALEVLLGTLTLPLVLPALASCTIATAVAWATLPTSPTYAIPAYGIHGSLVAWAVLIGPLAGLAAVAWVRLVTLANRLRPSGWWRLAAPLAVLGVLGLVSIAYPELLGNGQDTVQLAVTGGLSVGLLVALVLLRPMFTAACLGSGTPGGLFTPTLAYGVVFGALFGHLWSLLFPGAPEGTYALVGGGAVLAAAMQAPLAAVVLILELAHHTEPLMVPLLLAVTGATVVARRLGADSIYSARLGHDMVATGPVRPEAEHGPAVAALD